MENNETGCPVFTKNVGNKEGLTQIKRAIEIVAGW